MLEMPDERVKLLVYKYLADSLTEEEGQELNTLGSEHPQIWLLIARLQDEDQLTADLGEIHDMDVPGTLDECWALTNEEDRIPFYKRRIVRIAAILIPAVALLGGGILWLQHQRSTTPAGKEIVQRNKTAPAEIRGGSKKATLTLAGGQVLELQDQPLGNVAFQNGARIVKTDSALSYIPVPLPYTEVQRNAPAVQYNTLATARTGQFSVVLPDGTKVWLNDSSQLTYPTFFSGAYREVTLAGEAYFEVVKDADHPFHVKINGIDIHVMGTSFAVRAYSGDSIMTATLLKGKITVQNGRREIQLAPNQQVSIDRQKNLSLQSDIDPESAIAWKNGLFYFSHADIPTVMHELSKWYDIEVEIKVSANQYYYEGEFSRDVSLSEILNYLTNEDVHFHWEGNKVIVTP